MIVESSGFTPSAYLPPDFDMAQNKGEACSMAIEVGHYPVKYLDEKGAPCFVKYCEYSQVFYFLSFQSWDKVRGEMVLKFESQEKRYKLFDKQAAIL
jgi:hypothetical protein